MADDIQLRPLDEGEETESLQGTGEEEGGEQDDAGDEQDDVQKKASNKAGGKKGRKPVGKTLPEVEVRPPDDIMQQVNELKAQVQALLQNQSINTAGGVGMDANTFERVLRSVRTESSDEWYKYYEEVEVDKEDYLAKPVRFFAHSVGYIIVDKVSAGRAVLPPYKKPICFVYQGTRVVGNRKAKDVQTFCSYDCRSQKELQWLRTHPFYGVKFFEDAKKALTQDAAKANKIVSYVQQYQQKDAGFVRRQLEQLQIQATKDPHLNRVLLADYYASRDMDKEMKEAQEKASNIQKALEKFMETQQPAV